MGGSGTDVAREAAAIVLLDDDFGSIVRAVRLGRRIYDNLRKAVSFIFAVHLRATGLAILPLMFGLPVMLAPIHMAFLEMVIDPDCTLVFEAEEADIMGRPPRNPDDRLFSKGLIGWSLTQGLVAFAAVAAILFLGAQRQMPEDELRTLTIHTGDCHHRADLRQPVVQIISGGSLGASETGPCLRSGGGWRHSCPRKPLARGAREFPLWFAARR